MKIKKKYLILMVITLLVSVVTLTYAYFEGTILNDLINGTTVSTGNIGVEISDNVVNADNVIPIYNGSVNYEDASFKKTFTVTNSGTLNTCTELYLKVNTIDDALISTDFRYMVINDDTGTTIEGNFSTASSSNDLKLGSLYFFEGETTKKYTMYIWIEYQENKDQMSMLNKSMNAILFVKAQDVKTKDACDTRSNYKITYVLNGGTGKESEEVVKGGSVTLYTPTIADSGLSFGGWYSDSSMTNKVTSLSDINDDVKLYAMWSCTFDRKMVQGAEYVNGQYTYRYMQKGIYSSSGLAWANIEEDGWGVQLTDKTSTEPVTSKLCTYINNKPVISLSYMFSGSEATTIDLSSFNTSNVTNMKGMFYGSGGFLQPMNNINNYNEIGNGNIVQMASVSDETLNLNISNIDTSKVINMKEILYEPGEFIESVNNINNLNEYNTIDNGDIVQKIAVGDKGLILDLSNFDTSRVNDMSSMFSGSRATTLDLSSFDTSKVTNMSSMFSGSAATALDLSSFDTSKVTNMDSMFSYSNAPNLNLSSFDTSNVTNMSYMFQNSVATTLDLSNFNTNNVKNMNWMFYNSAATTIDLSSFNTSNVTDMSGMFSDSKVTNLDLSNFDTSNVTDMRSMFSNCSNLKTIYSSSKFVTTNVTSSTSMFSTTKNLVGGAGTVYDSTKVDKTYARIDGGTSSPGYFTAK